MTNLYRAGWRPAAGWVCVVGLANGLSILQASTEAQYAAALTVTKLGAQTSIPDRKTVLEFMASRAAK